MNLITMFQEMIKPIKLKGIGIVNPLATSIYDNNLKIIRQLDVNFFIYTKNNTSIAIDAGYQENSNLDKQLKDINANNKKIKAVFITHADIDHAGGLISENKFAPKADIYLHEKEEKMILGEERRFTVGPLKLKNPVKYKGIYKLFKDREIIYVDDIKIEIYHTPGHTNGHTVFLVDDKYLFTGDSIATNENGGYSFFDFYNMNTQKNIKSLVKLKELLNNKNNLIVCTSHNGIYPYKEAFSHITEIAKGTKKEPFDKMAPYDIFNK